MAKTLKLIFLYPTGTALIGKTFQLETLAHFGLVCENLSTQNSNELKVFFNANVEFLKVVLLREI